MQLTRAADYAVRVLIYMASLSPGERASRSTLAAASDVPDHFLSKVLQMLSRARLIVSHRGTAGGFALAMDAEDISLLRIVEAIEGPIQLNTCLTSTGCSRQSQCPAHPVWLEAQNALTQVLRNASIAKLARDSAAQAAEPVVQPWN